MLGKEERRARDRFKRRIAARRRGAKAWGTFGTLAATARKLGVSFYAYVQDRMTATLHLPALDQVIQARAQDLNLGMSWNTL